MSTLPGQRWFSVDSKSFEIEDAGEGNKAKVFITERQRGRSSWIVFGEEGARTLLKSVVSLRKEANKNIEGLGWSENGRGYSLELRKNVHGRFLLCSVIDMDGKRHRLLFPEGNALINKWTLLEEALQAMGYKEDKGEKRKLAKTSSLGKAERQKGGLILDNSSMEITSLGRRRQDTIWLDISECIVKEDLGLLKYGVVGSWKSQPATDLLLTEVEACAKRVWRLKRRIVIHPLNHNLFFLGFDSSEEAIWVMENGSRIFRGGVMQLEWWTSSSGCKGRRGQEIEVWIRVEGLPLHLWTGEIMKKVRDRYGSFVALDEETALKTNLHWARILVKMKSNGKPASVNLLAGARSYELQKWWDIRPTMAKVFPQSNRTYGGPTEPGEEDDREACAEGRVKPVWAVKCHTSRDEQCEMGHRSYLGNCDAAGSLSRCQMRGASSKAGAKQNFEFQNDLRVSPKGGAQKYPFKGH